MAFVAGDDATAPFLPPSHSIHPIVILISIIFAQTLGILLLWLLQVHDVWLSFGFGRRILMCRVLLLRLWWHPLPFVHTVRDTNATWPATNHQPMATSFSHHSPHHNILLVFTGKTLPTTVSGYRHRPIYGGQRLEPLWTDTVHLLNYLILINCGYSNWMF